MSISDVVRAARRDGPGRVSGFVEPLRAAVGTWVAFECSVEEEVARLDTKLVPTGAEIGTLVELVGSPVGDHEGRTKWSCLCSGCGERTRHLYVPSYHEPRFGCRRCARLSYASTRQTTAVRAAHRVWELRRRVGGAPAPLWEPFPERPPRMRRATWTELEKRAEENLLIYAAGIAAGTAPPALMVP